ncbi:MAG: cytochrome c-type biogenesis protein [Hyphomicrobiales bacterium]|nr:cytochrome c-type biogenesis protein [Hyphomicrobiales bacterium]
MRAIAAAFITSLLCAAPAGAVEPDEVLADPALERRARDISAGLRCLVCQNQSIDDSDAALARDLRLVVRERLKAGDTNEQAVAFIVARYGEFVLLRPPVSLSTALLWLAPVFLVGGGAALAWRASRGRSEESADLPLTPAEANRLKDLAD